MKNWIKYYYDIDVENIIQSNKEYNFYKDKIAYVLIPINRTAEEIEDLYNLVTKLHQLGIPCHQFVLNKDKEFITRINEKEYILMRKYVNSNELITYSDIIKFSNITTQKWNYPSLNRTNWKTLWIQKMDYFEYQLSQVGRHYPRLTSTFSYYEGITENAIQLIEMYNNLDNASTSVSHKRIDFDTTLNDFYNPLNFIIDYRIRDIAEYLKHKNNFVEIEPDLISFLFKTFILNDGDKILFMIRILFPSFYFDAYEKILINGMGDNSLLFIEKSKVYEKLIKKIYALVNTYIKFPNIDWLTGY